MKFYLRILPALLAFTGAATLHAQDTLYSDKKIQVTGVIRQPSNTAPTGTLTLPVKIADIVSLLGITGQDVKKLRYYYDDTIDGYVIAPSGIVDGGTGTPVATVFAYGISDVKWYGVNGKNPRYVESGSEATGFSGSLQGTRQDSESGTGNTAKLVTSLLLSGTVQSIPTVVQMTVSDTYVPLLASPQ